MILKHRYTFKKGDIVEWTEWKRGKYEKHEGEIIGNGGIYKHIRINATEVGDIKVYHRVRADYFQVLDFADEEKYVLHGSRLSRTKVKVAID